VIADVRRFCSHLALCKELYLRPTRRVDRLHSRSSEELPVSLASRRCHGLQHVAIDFVERDAEQFIEYLETVGTEASRVASER
jgi:hypothetical protein